MDASVRKELGTLLEELTHSGSATLDPNLVKRLKLICRSSDMYVRAVYEIVMGHLSKDHAEVRLSSFQVIKELFSRSHVFRELLISDFEKFSILVAGIDPHSPLPPPKPAAAQLKEKSLLAIREWHEKYGTGYPKLKLGYNYLKVNKKVNFEELVAQTEVVRRRHEERAGRQRTVLQQKIQEVKQEIKEVTRDIEECMTQITSCFNILMPRFDLPDIYSSTQIPAAGSENDPLQVVGESLLPCTGVAKDGTDKQTSSSSPSLSDDYDSTNTAIDNQQNSVTEATSNTHEDVDSDSEDSDSEFMRRHYGTHNISLSDSDDVKRKRNDKTPVNVALTDPVDHHKTVNNQSDFDSDSDSELEWEDVDPPATDFDLQAHGIATHGFSIPIQLDTVPVLREDENNSSVLITLRDNKHLLTDKYLPTISKWMEWLSKGVGEDTSLKEAIDLKHRVQLILDKFERISIIYKEPIMEEESVPEAPDIADSKPQAIVTNPEWEIQPPPTVSMFELELDPTTPQAQIAKIRKKLSAQGEHQTKPNQMTAQSKKPSLHSKAPVVPFGMDLYHWETPSNQLEPLTKAPVGSLHRFWVQEREVDVSSDEQARLKCRTIPFPGTFEPVTKTCRAKLPSGKLCPRMDRLKCPFHGRIIPRDENGEPVSEQSTTSVLPEDPVLQEAIRDAQGAQLLERQKEKKKGKGGKQKVKKHPGLTDLKVQVDTPRSRLERKVLSKRALKRVAESVDTANAKKYKDKFGYNFNYALSK